MDKKMGCLWNPNLSLRSIDSLNMWPCPSRKEQAKAPKARAPSRIANSFQVINNSPLSEWLIGPPYKEGSPKEVPSTEDRAGQKSLKAPQSLTGVPVIQVTRSCQERWVPSASDPLEKTSGNFRTRAQK
ncbi:hypothetical protein P7K49_006628 [Saguinus oedipus]|uniref:Testicular haploid expressed gene protein n=1 Tax=Saguinus oedipus TaxID=9490 RepID=A0ABQ9W6L5_SAGOE|nr:hypothetical protein P7K49_006628 [Saguinus oedipus]